MSFEGLPKMKLKCWRLIERFRIDWSYRLHLLKHMDGLVEWLWTGTALCVMWGNLYSQHGHAVNTSSYNSLSLPHFDFLLILMFKKSIFYILFRFLTWAPLFWIFVLLWASLLYLYRKSGNMGMSNKSSSIIKANPLLISLFSLIMKIFLTIFGAC